MSFERLLSLLLSLCLHLGLLALVLFWPTPKPLLEPPRGTFIPGLVTLGKAGVDMDGGKQAVPEPAKGRPDKPQTIEKPQPDNPEERTPAKVDTPDQTPPKPEVRPIEKPVEKPAEKPMEKPDPDTVPIPKDPEKKEPPKPEATAKPADKPKPKPADKPKQTQKPPKRESLDSTLADISKQVGAPKGRNTGRGRASEGKGQDLSSAIADIGKTVGSSGGASSGRGPGGGGGDGYGVLGAYQDSIISRVRPNWSWPGRTDRKNFTAVVNIQIDPDGTITNARIVSSSGNAYFDSTVLQAVAATQVLEPPPGPAYANINISFTPEALGIR